MAPARPISPIPLGTTASGAPYALRLADQPNQFIAVTGSTGTGKTTLLRMLASHIQSERVAVLALDFHGDLDIAGLRTQRLDTGELGIEPLANGASAADIIDNLRHAAPGLGHLQLALIRDELTAYLAQTSAPRLAELQRRLQTREASAQERQKAAGVLAALRALFDAPVFKAPRYLRPQDLLSGGRLVLRGLGTEARRFLATVILSQVFEALRQAGPTHKSGALRLFVVLDEAAVLKDAPEVETLVREARKFGLGLALASQQISDHNPAILANCSTLAAFHTPSRQEATEIERRTGIQREQLSALRPRGQAIVRTADELQVIDLAPHRRGKKATP